MKEMFSSERLTFRKFEPNDADRNVVLSMKVAKKN